MATRQKTIDIATGQWPAILPRLGIPSQYLSKRHGPCPFCGGTDRFRFDDKKGKGTFYCNSCGSGDGLDFLQKFKGVNFSEAARMVDEMLRAESLPPKEIQDPPADSREKMEALWKSGSALTENDMAGRYLKSRTGVTVASPALRVIHRAMIAKVSDPTGRGVQIHRTLFDEKGEKTGRMMMRAPLPAGSAIRLYEPVQGVLGVAEGIETAISARLLFGVPVWALINANNLEKWEPPEGVNHVMIFGDNDRSFTGQAASYALAKKLARQDLFVDVKIPATSGWDWNDELAGRVLNHV